MNIGTTANTDNDRARNPPRNRKNSAIAMASTSTIAVATTVTEMVTHKSSWNRSPEKTSR